MLLDDPLELENYVMKSKDRYQYNLLIAALTLTFGL